jgi:hypothetical protein
MIKRKEDFHQWEGGGVGERVYKGEYHVKIVHTYK